MQQEVVVRKAVPGDEHAVAALLRQPVRPDIHPLTIWNSARIESYIRLLLEDGGTKSGRDIYLLCKGGRAMGAILIQTINKQLFPQTIFVDPSERGSGLGNLLLGAAIEACSRKNPGMQEASLDVFEGSPEVESWYERLGGVEVGRKGWWLAQQTDLAKTQGLSAYECRGLAKADHDHAVRGFSSFDVLTGESAVEVGRLPGPYFRVMSRAAIEDPRFLFTLAAIDGARNILHIGATTGLAEPWKRHFVMRRLQFKIDPLIEEFRKRIGAILTQGPVEVACHSGK